MKKEQRNEKSEKNIRTATRPEHMDPAENGDQKSRIEQKENLEMDQISSGNLRTTDSEEETRCGTPTDEVSANRSLVNNSSCAKLNDSAKLINLPR